MESNNEMLSRKRNIKRRKAWFEEEEEEEPKVQEKKEPQMMNLSLKDSQSDIIIPFKDEGNQDMFKRMQKIKISSFTIIKISKIKEDLEKYLSYKKLISFFFILKNSKEKIISKISDISSKLFKCYFSAYDERYLYFFIGGELREPLGKTLNEAKGFEGINNDISFFTISIYNKYEFLMIDKSELIRSGYGYEFKNGFDENFEFSLKKKVEDILKYREENSD